MKIGLVLGAGGHPGYPFQVAVLQAVQHRLGVDLRTVDLVVGTSVGAMTGLLLRAGFGVDDLVAIARGQEPTAQGHHLLHEVLDPPGALPPALPGWKPPAPSAAGMRGVLRSLRHDDGGRQHRLPAAASGLFPRGRSCHDVLGHAADSLFPGGWPDLPTWVVALRSGDGTRTVFGRDTRADSVGTAVKAAAAIPGWFRPVEVDGVRHVDAGVRSTTNVDLVAEADLDLVVVVPPLGLSSGPSRLLDLPLRWLVNAQIRHEVASLDVPVAVASPPTHVARTLQGNPIRISDERAREVLDVSAAWARDWAQANLDPVVAPMPRTHATA